MKNIIVILIISISLISTSFAEDFAFAINQTNTNASISKAKLKRILEGKIKKWSTGTPVVIINTQTKSTELDALLKKVTRKNHSALNKMWQKMQIQGKGAAPMIQNSDDAAKAIASNIPGALIFIGKSKINGKIKELSIK